MKKPGGTTEYDLLEIMGAQQCASGANLQEIKDTILDHSDS